MEIIIILVLYTLIIPYIHFDHIVLHHVLHNCYVTVVTISLIEKCILRVNICLYNCYCYCCCCCLVLYCGLKDKSLVIVDVETQKILRLQKDSHM